MDEVILVDEQDRQIGLGNKVAAHLGSGMRHRAFSVFIFNAKGELLLQRRSARKMLWPLYWSNTCCSHPRAGEDYQASGERRLKEELGFTCPLARIGAFTYQASYKDVGSENERCSVLVGTYDGTVTPLPEEVAEYAWIDFEAVKKDALAHPERYTPWFTLELARFFAEGAPERGIRCKTHRARSRAQHACAAARQFLFDEVVYNGHLQTWGAVALIVSIGQILAVPEGGSLLLAVYLLFYLIYLHDRYRGVDGDALTNAKRSLHLRAIYRAVPAILITGFGILAALVYAFGTLSAVGFVALLALGGVSYPLFMKGVTRHILAFKNAYVALVFSALVALPNLYYGISFTERTALLAALLALFIFSRGLLMQFFLDLKDIEGDKAQGLRTLGVVWGKEKTLRFAGWLNLGIALAAPLGYALFPATLPSAVSFLALSAFGYRYAAALVRKGNPAGFILEGAEFVTWPALVYLGYLLVG